MLLVSVVFIFRFCKVRYHFDIIAAICDIVHDVETTVHLCERLTASEKLFQHINDAPRNCKSQFSRHYSYFILLV